MVAIAVAIAEVPGVLIGRRRSGLPLMMASTGPLRVAGGPLLVEGAELVDRRT